MKRLLRLAASLPFRILPPALRRRAIQAGLTAAAAGEPRAALRELLQIETDLQGMIDETARASDATSVIVRTSPIVSDRYLGDHRPADSVGGCWAIGKG